MIKVQHTGLKAKERALFSPTDCTSNNANIYHKVNVTSSNSDFLFPLIVTRGVVLTAVDPGSFKLISNSMCSLLQFHGVKISFRRAKVDVTMDKVLKGIFKKVPKQLTYFCITKLVLCLSNRIRTIFVRKTKFWWFWPDFELTLKDLANNNYI